MRDQIPFRIAARAGLIGKAQAAGCLVKPLLVWDFYFFQLAKQIENAYHSIWILPLGCICWKREPVLARKGFLLFYYNPVCKEKKACSKSRHTLITLWIHLFLLFAFFLSSLSFIKCCSTSHDKGYFFFIQSHISPPLSLKELFIVLFHIVQNHF